MPTRLAKAWPLKVRIFWCREGNVPVLGEECEDDDVLELNLTEPGDARPAFPKDIDRIREAYRNEVKDLSGFKEFIGNGVILLNKVPYMDLMYEIVSEGAVIGRVYWDPLLSRWRLRFSLPGLLRLNGKDPLPKLKIKGGLKTLMRTRVFKNSLSLPPHTQVVLVDDMNNLIGIAYVSEDAEVIKTHNIFRKKALARYSSGRNATWDDVLKKNDYYLYYYKSRGIKFIYVMAEKVKKPITVSFSGGKDSLVALHLTLEAGYKPVLIFNNTGLELPETISMVEKVSSLWNLEVLTADAGDAFWRAVEMVGPPGRDYRWCCKIAKLAPLARLFLEKFPNGALNIVGQRAFESLERAKSPRVWRNKWIPHILSITPIQDWSQLLVWLYIWKHRLPYNPLYEEGFDRIGCFMCPAAYIAEYNFVKDAHPEMWSKWEGVLKRWAKRLGFDDDLARLWVEKGLWRWLTPAAQKLRLARRLKVKLPPWVTIYKKWLVPSLEAYSVEDKGVELRLKGKVNPKAVGEQFSVLGAFNVVKNSKEEVVLRGPKDVKLIVKKELIKVQGAKGVLARELVLDAVKLTFRWENCAGCRACEVSCPTGSIKVVDVGGARYRPKVNAKTCIHCKLCIDNCPLSDVVIEKIFPALMLNEVTAWKRKGKRTHESVVNRYLKLRNLEISDKAKLVDEDSLTAPGST